MTLPLEDEFLDVRDRNGLSTGVRKKKAEVHRDGDWHRAVHVWIVTPSREVLLQKRAAVKENHPGMWDVSAAGHVSAGELAWDAAIRETAEELGLSIAKGELHQVARLAEEHVLNEGRYVDREIHEIFVVVREVDPDALTLQVTEVYAARLVPAGEFRAMVERRDPELVPHWDEYAIILDRL